MMRHNLSNSATWRLQLYDSQNQTGNLVHDSGNIAAVPAKALGDLDWGIDTLGATLFDHWDEGNKFCTMWFPQVTALSATVTISDPTNPDGYLQVSRLFGGAARSPQTNIVYGMTNGWQENTKQYRTAAGSLRSDPLPAFRKFDITLNELTPSERSAFFEDVRIVGLRKDFLCSIFPEKGGAIERDHTISCKLTSMPTFKHWAFERYSTTLNLAEA